ncbi:Microtubule binding [Rhizoctonia solani]|uniref:Microtubule binding n=1 Tax=Rhizoctonia solani TaxID=456999 RepID=A0A8H7M9P6_9AGAM|nr:Microtubule binding [Rhizoctonia solani]
MHLPTGVKELRKAVADLYNHTYRQGKKSQYTYENVCIVPGGRAGLSRVAAVIGDVYCGYQVPEYTTYSEVLSVFKRLVPIPTALTPESRYKIDINQAKKDIGSQGLQVIVASNPRNPTAMVVRGEELRDLVRLCENHCTVVLDEFYSWYIYSDDEKEAGVSVSAAAYVEDVDDDAVVIIDGLTKNWRLPGWRVCWVVGPRNLISALSQSGSFLDGGANHPLQLAAVPLLDPEYVKQSKLALQKHFRAKRDHVLKRLEKIGLPVAMTPESTFYIWLDLRALPAPLNDGLTFFEELLKEKTIVVPGIFFEINPAPVEISSPLHATTLFGFLMGRHLRTLTRVSLDAIERVFRRAKREGLDNIGVDLVKSPTEGHFPGAVSTSHVSPLPGLTLSGSVILCVTRSPCYVGYSPGARLARFRPPVHEIHYKGLMLEFSGPRSRPPYTDPAVVSTTLDPDLGFSSVPSHLYSSIIPVGVPVLPFLVWSGILPFRARIRDNKMENESLTADRRDSEMQRLERPLPVPLHGHEPIPDISTTSPKYWKYISEGGATIVFSYRGPPHEVFSHSVVRLRKAVRDVSHAMTLKQLEASGIKVGEVDGPGNSEVVEPEEGTITRPLEMAQKVRLKGKGSNDSLRSVGSTRSVHGLRRMGSSLQVPSGEQDSDSDSGWMDDSDDEGLGEEEQPDDPTIEFQSKITSKLIPLHYLPRLDSVKVGKRWIAELARISERMRPVARRRVDGIDLKRKKGVVADDLPKWGFLPDPTHLSPRLPTLWLTYGQAYEFKALEEFLDSQGQGVRGAFVETLGRMIDSSPLLAKLSLLMRSLDALDIEGIEKLWRQAKHVAMVGMTPQIASDEAEPSLDDWEEFVAEYLLHGPYVSSEPYPTDKPREEDLRYWLTSYLMSATFKDCSVMLRFPPGKVSPDSTFDNLDRDVNMPLMTAIDLDPKSMRRLQKWFDMDREIVRNYAHAVEERRASGDLYSSTMAGPTVTVQVAVRIRPGNEHDLTHIPARFQKTVVHAQNGTTVAVDAIPAANNTGSTAPPPKKQVFTFDQAHSPGTTQHQLFSTTAAPLVERFVQGFNCTVLAYGQTSSGKTYTMSGIDLDGDPNDPDNGMGIIPRAVATIFNRARELKEERGAGWQYTVKASFVELYNEDLIDLLSDDVSGRREVQIREDKDGTIIWGGLREVPVKGWLILLRQGTSLRRTNETDMNAQSSRSHAIFSLTLVQKKYNGSAPLPRSSLQAPTAASGRTSPLPSPSRLARPGSMLVGGKDTSGRVSSPTFGRPSTPSFTSAIGRGTGIRPASAMALRSPVNHPGAPDEDEKAPASGEWVSVVSKFHFVDLAGSERLKRTAAQGERVKEGISINGGLLALGNVISALGDPSKSRSGHVHVPYRDSKLTRLLQDSLGGNAHTLMIACVSPAEYNAAETINTLKYANRARNIRNRAEIKEKEEGWEDLEWLQGQVSKLRKEVKALKEGGAVSSSGGPTASAAETEAKEQELQVLQSEYDDMRQRLAGTSEELARLRLTLEDRGGAAGGAGKYEEIVAPVIEEYEKQISHMETQIALQKTAVRHTENELADREAELEDVQKRANQADGYIEELRLRLGKAAEQERSRESYVRDLEHQIKTFTESTSSTSGTLVELQRELARYRETESTNSHYISDLESRLARQDKDVESLRNDMAKLERELAQSRERCKTMDSLVESLRAEREAERRDRNEWSKMLEAREKKVEELETRMADVEKMRAELQSERERLGNAVGGVERARRSIEFVSPAINGSGESSIVSEELEQLRKKHAETLQDLNAVNSRYQDALHDISDLYAQINEAKLQAVANQAPPVPPLPPTETNGAGEEPRSPPTRRRAGSRAALESPSLRPSRTGADSPSQKRLFFRHAASSESLHARSQLQSVSLSQELSSARSPKSLFANGSENSEGSDANVNTNGIKKMGHRPQLSLQLPTERSAEDLEKEIQSLQAILKAREAEIVALENTIKENEREASFRALSSGTEIKINGMHTNGDFNPRDSLSPETMRDFAEIRKSLEVLPTNGENADASLNRLDELMRSMAKKESQHRELVDGLNDELDKLKKQHEDLTALSRDQTHNMSMEMDALKTRLNESDEKHTAITAELEQIRAREQELQEQIRDANESYASEIANLKSEHAVELERRDAAYSAKVAELQAGHETSLAQAAALLATTRHEYAESLGAMQSENEDDLRKQTQEHEAAIAAIKIEHQAKLEELRAAQAAALSAHTTESGASAARMREEHQSAIERLKTEHSETLSRVENEGFVALQRLKSEHAAMLKQVDIAREGTLAESMSSQAVAIQQLQDEHSAAIARKETAIKEDMESAKAEHARILKRREEEHEASLKAAIAKHEAALDDLRKAHSIELETISVQLQEAAAAHASALEQSRATHEEALRRKAQEHAGVLNEKELSYQHSLAQLKASHQAELAATQLTLVSNQVEHKDALDSALSQREEQLVRLREEHEQKILQLKEAHTKDKSELDAKYQAAITELEDHKSKLEMIRSQESSIAGAESAHQAALEKLGHELSEATEGRAALSAEVEVLRAQLEEAQSHQVAHAEESTKHQATADELEREREVVSNLQKELQKAAEEREALEVERNRQDALIKELQSQLVAKATTPEPSEEYQRSAPRASEGGRNMSYARTNGLPPAKLPPLTPPPSIPPPPLPSSVPPVPSIPESATTRTGTTSIRRPNAAAQLEKQARQLDEAQAMIKTLNKQLTHCEGDLQAHMDLVATLETSLSDSERNLRKSRNQSMELVKERDSLINQVQTLRSQLEEAQQEIAQVRRTVVEEKHSLEQRLDDERRAKDRARQQLESRMEELQRRKSKFASVMWHEHVQLITISSPQTLSRVLRTSDGTPNGESINYEVSWRHPFSADAPTQPRKGMLLPSLSAVVLLAPSVLGAIVWDGRFNNYSGRGAAKLERTRPTSTGIYMYAQVDVDIPPTTHECWVFREKRHRHGTRSGQYKNPATTTAKQGVKVKINANSIWNGGTMLRSELIPQTTSSLSGHLYFHVSLQIPTVNPPDPNYEHQIVFWEAAGHYADIKYGQLAGQNGVADVLRVITGGKTIWSVTPVKGTWYNFILETGSPGGLWVSTGGNALTKVYSGSLNGNGGTDWHIGALRLPNGNTNTITEENIYYSGVYVEDSGPTTTP